MIHRAAAALLLSTVALAFAREATAQYVPPPPYFGPASRMVPPGAIPAVPADDDDDAVEVAPPVQMRPLPPPDGRAGPYYSSQPLQPGPGPRQAMPGIDPRGPADATQAMRPPADVGETTGAVANAAPGESVGSPVALLPPDYQPEEGPQRELAPNLRRQLVDFATKEPVGTIIIDTQNTYLYLVTAPGKAMRYGVGVGRDGFTWAGREKITRMAEWPDWFPPTEMIERQPYLPRFMAGGPTNPLGARALYLGKTVYRIHGTNQPSTIGTFVSSGCIRLINEDVEDLYSHVKVGTRVVVLPGNAPPATATNAPASTASNTPAPVSAAPRPAAAIPAHGPQAR